MQRVKELMKIANWWRREVAAIKIQRFTRKIWFVRKLEAAAMVMREVNEFLPSSNSLFQSVVFTRFNVVDARCQTHSKEVPYQQNPKMCPQNQLSDRCC